MAFFTEKWLESAQGPSWGECERPYSPGNESIQLGSVSGTKTTTIVVTATLVLCRALNSVQGAVLRAVNPPNSPGREAWLLFPFRLDTLKLKRGKNPPRST